MLRNIAMLRGVQESTWDRRKKKLELVGESRILRKDKSWDSDFSPTLSSNLIFFRAVDWTGRGGGGEQCTSINMT